MGKFSSPFHGKQGWTGKNRRNPGTQDMPAPTLPPLAVESYPQSKHALWASLLDAWSNQSRIKEKEKWANSASAPSPQRYLCDYPHVVSLNTIGFARVPLKEAKDNSSRKAWRRWLCVRVDREPNPYSWALPESPSVNVGGAAQS